MLKWQKKSQQISTKLIRNLSVCPYNPRVNMNMTTDIHQRYQTSYTAPCNGVGLRVVEYDLCLMYSNDLLDYYCLKLVFSANYTENFTSNKCPKVCPPPCKWRGSAVLHAITILKTVSGSDIFIREYRVYRFNNKLFSSK